MKYEKKRKNLFKLDVNFFHVYFVSRRENLKMKVIIFTSSVALTTFVVKGSPLKQFKSHKCLFKLNANCFHIYFVSWKETGRRGNVSWKLNF